MQNLSGCILVQWQDFDFEGRLKVPLGFYLGIVYLLRGFIIWIISLTYSDDRSLLLGLIYSDSSLFGLTIITGLPALFTFFLFSLKKQKEKSWYKAIWALQIWFLLTALLTDFILQFYTISYHITQIHWVQMVLLIVGGYLFWYWFKSDKIKRFFRNWLL